TRRQALRRVGALLGGVVSAPTVAGVLSGCQRQGGSDWTPSVLSAAQNEMIDTMAEIMIPATDTPGASAANVNRFIDAIVGESWLEADRKRFMGGLEETQARAKEQYGAPFGELSAEEQTAFVAELDEEHFGADAEEPDREEPPFYRSLKELVIVGYYTSEVGATQELQTNIVPGYYDGDVPYEEVGRAWSGAGT
ncbi:MAG: gluconate 2-dehydrogenase subunit 3 family protein, partial [Salinivenus sp.]